MKHGGIVAIGLAGGLLAHLTALAVTSDNQLNPYDRIVDRNVFNLKDPPPPEPPKPPEQPASKITLLGIVSGLGPKQVMFKALMGTPPKEKSYMLSAGEILDDFEVLEINEQAGTVVLKNRNDPQNLSLEKDGMKPGAAAPAAPGLPGAPGQRIPPPQPFPGLPRPAPQAAAAPAPTGGSTMTTFGAGSTTPNRPLRVSATSSGEVGVPGGSVLGTANRLNNRAQVPQQQQPMDPTEQMIMMEVNRKLTEKQVAEGLMPPLPPTPLTDK